MDPMSEDNERRRRQVEELSAEVQRLKAQFDATIARMEELQRQIDEMSKAPGQPDNPSRQSC
jgi:hypothetical protein